MAVDGRGLGDLLLELLAIPSVTGDERGIADWLEARYRAAGEPIRRVGDSLVVGGLDDPRPAVLLAGHTDTVPPTPTDGPPTREGDRIVGRGSSDMKAGLAVAMACFEDPTLRNGPYACILVAYAAEEGAYDTNELALVLDEVGGLRRAQLAVVLEPTNLDVHLGAMGALHAEFGFHGRAAHSARPWQGQSALTKALPLLADLAGRQPLDVSVDGLGWREVVTATRAWTGDAGSGRITNARNVVPDRFTVNVNYRYAPDKRPEQAEEVVAELAAACGADEVHIVDHAPAGPPHREAPLVARFVEVTAARIEPKQAWTDAARFAALGVPAVNYGPGLTAQAHQPGEYVPEANLAVAADRLAAFLAGRTLGGRSLGTAAPAAAPSGRRGGPAAGSAGG